MNANMKRDGAARVTVTNTYEATMPGVVAGYEAAVYQKHDYQIAATTFLMNRELAKEGNPLNSAGGNLPTHSNNHTIGTDLPGTLDVNVVKAMIIQESGAGTYTGGAGTGPADPMQVNNKGDWGGGGKAQVGLTKGQAMTPEISINAAVGWLFLKGMGSSGAGVMNWRNGQGGDWWNAVDKYKLIRKLIMLATFRRNIKA